MARQPKGGPKSALDDELIKEIEEMAKRCIFFENIAVLCGVRPHTLRKWVSDGRETERLMEIEAKKKEGYEPTIHQQNCVRVYYVLKKARVEVEVELLEIARRAAGTTWQAAWRYLEVLKPERYGQNRYELANLKREIRDLEQKVAQVGMVKG